MPSDLADEDILLRQAARGQSDIFPSLVEATFSRAWTVMGGSRGGVLFVYRSMRDHLDEVDSRTRFWDWFTQIAAIPRIRSASDISVPEVPPGALAELLESLEGPAAPRSRGLFTRLVRLHLSGWLTAFSVSMILTFLIVDRGEGPAFHIATFALAPITAIVAASISSFLLGPWLSRRYQILNPLMLLPVAVSSSLFVYSSLDMFADGSLDLKQAAINGLRLLKNRDLIPSALGALFVTCMGYHLTLMKSWIINRSRSSWRKLLSLLAFCSLFGFIGYQVGPTVVGGWKLAPEILAAVPTLHYPSRVSSYVLPKTYIQHPAILRLGDSAANTTPTFEQLESARAVWLQHVRKEWPAPGKFASNPHLQAYLHGHETYSLSTRYLPDSPQQAEVIIRMALINPQTKISSLRDWTDIPNATWGEFADLAAAEEWRVPASRLAESKVWSEFHYDLSYERLDTSDFGTNQNRDLGQSLLVWYEHCEKRSRLNEAAQALRQLLPPLLDSEKPWTKEMEKQIQQLIWRIYHSSVLYKALNDENARRNTAELALRLELKNLQANGKPQPKQPSDLRPPFNEIAETYADWFTLEKLWAELSPAK